MISDKKYVFAALLVVFLGQSIFFPKSKAVLSNHVSLTDTVRRDSASGQAEGSTIPRFVGNFVAPNDSTQKDSSLVGVVVPQVLANRPTDSIRLATSDVSYLAVCAGASVQVPFEVSGPFNPDNVFKVEFSASLGEFRPMPEATRQSPLKTQIPADWAAGQYQVRVVSSSPRFVGTASSVSVLPGAHAHLDFADGNFTTKIGPGQNATLRVSFTGAGPWSFALSDGTVVKNTFINPYTKTVAPPISAAYKLTGVGNACGSGSKTGEAVLQVSRDTVAKIALRAVPKNGFRVCTGVPLQINFAATGKYFSSNRFEVQIADTSNRFVPIMADSTAPLVAKIPFGTRAGRYKLRVASSFPVAVSDTADVEVSLTATTILQKDTLDMDEGKGTALTLRFGGGGPWFALLTDGTYVNDIRDSVYSLKVNPYNSTAYGITSAGGLCGVGDYGGGAYVRVKIPPTTISTVDLSSRVVCAATEIDVPFTTTGRFWAANQFKAQIADSLGNWTDLPSTGRESPLRVKIKPTYAPDTLSQQRIRVVATAPATEGSSANLRVYQLNSAQALLAGGGVIRPGGAARLQISFKNGLPPWSFSLSDGTSISGTFINPYRMTVAPRTTVEYKVTSVTNTCGAGAAVGAATVKVDTN